LFWGFGVPNFVDLCRPPAEIASVLDAGKGRLGQTVAAVKDHGAGALHIAAFPGRTALCAYLVEELHQDVNAADEWWFSFTLLCLIVVDIYGHLSGPEFFFWHCWLAIGALC
jgi:hypothetical protein